MSLRTLWAGLFRRPDPNIKAPTITVPITAETAREMAWMFYGLAAQIENGELEWDREHNGGLAVCPYAGEGLRIYGDVAFKPLPAVTHDWKCDACGGWNPDRRDENPCACSAPRPAICEYRKRR